MDDKEGFVKQCILNFVDLLEILQSVEDRLQKRFDIERAEGDSEVIVPRKEESRKIGEGRNVGPLREIKGQRDCLDVACLQAP